MPTRKFEIQSFHGSFKGTCILEVEGESLISLEIHEYGKAITYHAEKEAMVPVGKTKFKIGGKWRYTPVDNDDTDIRFALEQMMQAMPAPPLDIMS